MSLQQFINDESGQSMVEYGVVLGSVAAVSYIAVVQLGDKTADLYAWMANHLPGGEENEVGTNNQVRVSEGGRHGLVALTATNEGLKFEAEHMLEEGTMSHTLGSNSTLVD
jgi:Flp pilus assembly pilin Flp